MAVEEAPAEAPPTLTLKQVNTGRSTMTAVAPTSAQQAAPEGGSSSSQPGGFINGFKQAGNDFIVWWYLPHGSFFDNQMASLDASGAKREFVGYGLIALFVVLQLTRFGPFLANSFCIAYPLIASLNALRNQSAQETGNWLIYWSLFGLFSLLDVNLALPASYWTAKAAICVWLFLPQTQGAKLAYGLLLEPAVNFIDANIAKKFV